MRVFFTAYAFACLVGIADRVNAQIIAVTTDGKKVILNSDGTWKYIFEDNGKKVILNPDGTWRYDTTRTAGAEIVKSPPAGAVKTPASENPGGVVSETVKVPHDSATTAARDSTKMIPAKPVIKKVPLNLDCGYLVAVERDNDAGRFAAESRKVMVSENPKNAFSVLFKKTKNTPLQWVTTLSVAGQCIDEDSKMNIAFKDGSRLQIPNDGKSNCNGTFSLYFGGIYGKESILESLQGKEISGVRIWTTKNFVDGNFTDDNSVLFKAIVNCIAATK